MPMLEASRQHTPDKIQGAESEVQNEFLQRVQEARTFQQLIWAAETMRTENGPSELERELAGIEAEEETGDPELTKEIRQSKTILRKVMGLRTRRAELNAVYREKLSAVFTSGSDEVFAVHAVNLEKMPGDIEKSEFPIIIAPGFTVGSESVRRNAIGLAELGHSAMTFEVPPETTIYDRDAAFPPATPEYTKHHATALLRTIDTGNEKIFSTPRRYNVIGYSFGAIVAITAAIAEPEKFHSIVLINPGGLTHIDDPYLLRFAKMAINATAHKRQVIEEAGKKKPSLRERLSPSHIMEALSTIGEMPDLDADKKSWLHGEFSTEMKSIGKRGGLKGAVEIADAISQANLIPLIRELESKGVKIGILAAEKDPLFPVDQIETSGQKAGVPTYNLAGAHANLGFNPGPTSELCIDTFRELDPEEFRT